MIVSECKIRMDMTEDRNLFIGSCGGFMGGVAISLSK